MKRIFLLAVAALLACCLCASALGEVPGISDIMVVVNCNEWVSLRASASTGAERLAQVPLGAIVTNCAPVDGNFTRCEYEGLTGYILSEYLEAANDAAYNWRIVTFTVGGVQIMGSRTYSSDAESLEISAFDESGARLWSSTVRNDFATELTGTDCFAGGTAEDPRVMVYSEERLSSLNPRTGEAIWTLTGSDAALGGSISKAVGADGTMYIGGYYGPDPVAISMDGSVLWRARGDEDVYWLFEIEVTDEGIVATYDAYYDSDSPGRICFGPDGSILWKD